MKPMWDDLNARARGLGTRFFTRPQLEALSREPGLQALSDALRRHGVPIGEAGVPPQPESLELGIRRWAAAALRTLARWAGPRVVALPILFDGEDRRSLRALLRGAVQRTSAERRLAGLIPTPALPERALRELARAPTTATVVALLSAWRHPFAAALAPVAAAAQPDLFGLDLALSRAFAARATAAARAARDASVRDFVRESVDLENGVAALVLAVEGEDVVPKDAFLLGGDRVTIVAFEEAVATREPGAAGARIAAALHGTPYAGVFQHGARDPTTIEDELLRRRLAAWARRAHQQPLGPLPLLWFTLRLRAQLLDLQRVVWTIALGAPRLTLSETLATVAR
jgi:vacuolar-type H+-ATPase subunit C/Vma6